MLITFEKLFAEQINTLAITPGANKVNKRWKAGGRELATEQLRMRVSAKQFAMNRRKDRKKREAR